MISPIMKDPSFLSRKSTPATVLALHVAQELWDTPEAHRDDCLSLTFFTVA